jgi:hypothetical protein
VVASSLSPVWIDLLATHIVCNLKNVEGLLEASMVHYMNLRCHKKAATIAGEELNLKLEFWKYFLSTIAKTFILFCRHFGPDAHAVF